MADPCEMTLEVLSRDDVGPLRVEILGAPRLCIDPGGVANLLPYAGTLRVTNMAGTPVTVTHGTGEAAPLAFRASQVGDAGTEVAPLALGVSPIDPAEVGEAQVALGQGEALTLDAWSRHLSVLRRATMANEPVAAGPAVRDKSGDRRFVVVFSVALGVDGVPGLPSLVRAYPVEMRARMINDKE